MPLAAGLHRVSTAALWRPGRQTAAAVLTSTGRACLHSSSCETAAAQLSSKVREMSDSPVSVWPCRKILSSVLHSSMRTSRGGHQQVPRSRNPAWAKPQLTTLSNRSSGRARSQNAAACCSRSGDGGGSSGSSAGRNSGGGGGSSRHPPNIDQLRRQRALSQHSAQALHLVHTTQVAAGAPSRCRLAPLRAQACGTWLPPAVRRGVYTARPAASGVHARLAPTSNTSASGACFCGGAGGLQARDGAVCVAPYAGPLAGRHRKLPAADVVCPAKCFPICDGAALLDQSSHCTQPNGSGWAVQSSLPLQRMPPPPPAVHAGEGQRPDQRARGSAPVAASHGADQPSAAAINTRSRKPPHVPNIVALVGQRQGGSTKYGVDEWSISLCNRPMKGVGAGLSAKGQVAAGPPAGQSQMRMARWRSPTLNKWRCARGGVQAVFT